MTYDWDGRRTRLAYRFRLAVAISLGLLAILLPLALTFD